MILTACSLSVRAQDPIAIPFTSTEIYLPVTTYFVKQASDGLIWFSTDAGVFSYNGYNITNYSSANGLSDNEIFRIYEDNKHRLWFLGLNGKCSYYYNGEIFNEENDPMLQKLRFNTMISAETEDRDGNLYIASREGQIYRITPDNQVTMTENENGVFFLYAFRDTVLNIPQYFNKKIGRLPRGGQMGDLVIASIEREIYVLNRDNSFTLITTLPEESQEIIFLGVKADSTIYAGTRNGLYQVSVPDGKILSVNFRGLSITSVTTDDDGQLWLSTLDKGLFLVPSLYNDVYNLSSGWPGNRIFSIYKDKQDSLFISMPGNWYSVIAPDSSFQHFQIPGKRSLKLEISQIRKFGDDTWIVAKSGIYRLTPTGNKLYRQYANDLYVYDDTILIAQQNILKFSLPEYEAFDREVAPQPSRTDPYLLIPSRCGQIQPGRTGEFWFATVHGLYCYRNGQVIDFGDHDIRLSNYVRGLEYDSLRNILYVATNTTGILMLENDQIVAEIDTRCGLPFNESYAVKLDDKGVLWASSSNELIRVLWQDGKPLVDMVGRKLGLYSSRILNMEFRGNELYLGTETGLIRIDTSRVVPTTAPRLYLRQIRAGQTVIADIDHIQLPYRQNGITIEYTGIYFRRNAPLQYQYLLEGYDKEWQTTTDRSLNFRSLPPGDYIFHVKAVNTNGDTSETLSIPFSIATPFWQTTWFIALTGLAFLGLITLLWRWRLQHVHRRYEKEKSIIETGKKLAELEHKTFKLQMNPHFIFNTLNSIKGYYAEQNTVQANEYITKFSRLLRNILESDAQYISLEQEIQALSLYMDLMQLRYDNSFSYHIDTTNVETASTAIPPMLLQPFVENSIIHGIHPLTIPGELNISFRKSGKRLLCTITDNGVGRTASHLQNRNKEHQSKGMQIIRDFFAAMNSQLEEDAFTMQIRDLEKDGKPGGTVVEITMLLITLL